MFQNLDLFAISCFFFVTAEFVKGEILPPQNVSLLWLNDFTPQLKWDPPQHSVENCKYEVRRDDEAETDASPSWKKYVVMDGGILNVSITTLCGSTRSKPTVFTMIYKELVRDLQCHIYSSKETNCSWTVANPVQDLGFFYELVNEDLTTSIDNDISLPLQECPSYSYTNGVRTGCGLQAKVTQDIHIFFNGTLDNQTVRNNFKKVLKDNVRPPPLNWTVKKKGDKFLISWDPPDIAPLSYWKFKINYTECNEIKFKVVSEKTSTELNLVPRCPYRIAIKADSIGGGTPWSEKTFDAESDYYYFYLMIGIVVPLMFAVLTAMAFVLWRRNKDYIFPKIPEPRNFLIDIPDNNNTSTFGKLYVPADEEDCKITLALGPPNNNLYS